MFRILPILALCLSLTQNADAISPAFHLITWIVEPTGAWDFAIAQGINFDAGWAVVDGLGNILQTGHTLQVPAEVISQYGLATETLVGGEATVAETAGAISVAGGIVFYAGVGLAITTVSTVLGTLLVAQVDGLWQSQSTQSLVTAAGGWGAIMPALWNSFISNDGRGWFYSTTQPPSLPATPHCSQGCADAAGPAHWQLDLSNSGIADATCGYCSYFNKVWDLFSAGGCASNTRPGSETSIGNTVPSPCGASYAFMVSYQPYSPPTQDCVRNNRGKCITPIQYITIPATPSSWWLNAPLSNGDNALWRYYPGEEVAPDGVTQGKKISGSITLTLEHAPTGCLNVPSKVTLNPVQ